MMYGFGSIRRLFVPTCSFASASTFHWNTARSCPPTVTTFRPPPAKRTFTTCEECPTYPTQSPVGFRPPFPGFHSIRRNGAC